MTRSALIVSISVAASLAGCDLFGDSAEKLAAAKEAEGRAVGSACRHAARAIEDCYALNKKADKAAVFAGWRDMNDYMRENKIDPVLPQAGGVGRASKVDKPEKPEKPEKPDKPEKVEAKPASDPAEPTATIEKKPAQATPKPADS